MPDPKPFKVYRVTWSGKRIECVAEYATEQWSVPVATQNKITWSCALSFVLAFVIRQILASGNEPAVRA